MLALLDEVTDGKGFAFFLFADRGMVDDTLEGRMDQWQAGEGAVDGLNRR
jgi:ribosomal protein S27AE